MPPPYLRRSAIIARMMGPASRSEIPNVAMATTAVAILVHGQLSIIGKIRGSPRASGIFYCRQNGVPKSPALRQLSRTRRDRRGVVSANSPIWCGINGRKADNLIISTLISLEYVANIAVRCEERAKTN